MEDATKRRRRVARLTSYAVGGGVALALAFAAPSAAQDVVVQDATVVNGGVALANSGGNTAVGNDSTNVAVTGQSANGVLGGFNSAGGGGNSSSGTASVTTGSSTAVGSTSQTAVAQSAATGGGAGPNVVSQDATVINAGVGVANSGGNSATGNDSTNVAVTGQDADGALAFNNAGGGNTSTGDASIVTGSATAVGTDADTVVTQAATDGDGDGVLDVTVQDAAVINLGLAVANSGLNRDVVGNDSANAALTLQQANGLLAANNGGGGNSSSGNASVVTGAATAVGVEADVIVDQGVAGADDGGIDIVFQQPVVLTIGGAFANTGLNSGVTGNDSFNLALLVQSTGGLVASNAGSAGNQSTGTASVVTGNATAAGTRVITAVRQRVA